MSVTARDIIRDALTEIGVYQPGESPNADDYALGLLRFQNQIDAWNAENLTLATNDRSTHTIASGTSQVTVGPTGDLVAARPTFITGVNYIVPGSSPQVEVPLGPMDDDSYASLSVKQLSSSLPTQYYFNPTSPNATFILWPVVNQSVTLAFYIPTANSAPVSLNTVMYGPPGYQEAFMYQLALRLCTPFSRQMPSTLLGMATEAYARMKRVNVEPGLLGVDQALAPSYGGAFNVITGNFSGSGR